MFDGDTFGPHCGHSAECVKKWDGKVVVSVFGGQTRRSLCSSTHIYKWCMLSQSCRRMVEC